VGGALSLFEPSDTGCLDAAAAVAALAGAYGSRSLALLLGCDYSSTIDRSPMCVSFLQYVAGYQNMW